MNFVDPVKKSSVEDFPHNAHHREISISVSNYTLKHGDAGLIIVGGRTEMQPYMHLDPFEEIKMAEESADQHRRSASEKEMLRVLWTYTILHFMLLRGELVPFAGVERMSWNARSFENQFSELCHIIGREDTMLKLAHFRRHKRKSVKRTPRKTVGAYVCRLRLVSSLALHRARSSRKEPKHVIPHEKANSV
ncbi:hypothetical protein HanRHA438_Chr13g0601751 [Helianthus annuus]|nr:hypothetical protein HanRHA438_Chr13g0601751 [Helianthus annuus]